MVNKILFVDDEKSLCIKVKKFLSSKGFNVTVAHNGSEAIDILNKEPYPLIISDIVMDKIDGFKILRYTKKNLPESLTIILTGYDSLHSAAKAAKEQAYDYIIKPFDSSYLILSINRAFDIIKLKSLKKETEKKLKALETKDALTGLNNLSNFYTVLSKEVKRSLRYNNPLSLMSIKFSDFNKYLDGVGTGKANNLLIKFSNILKKCTRETDSCYRYGNEKFAVILPETEIKMANQVKKRIDKNFNNYISNINSGNNKKSNIDISCGISEYKKGYKIKDFVRTSDAPENTKLKE